MDREFRELNGMSNSGDEAAEKNTVSQIRTGRKKISKHHNKKSGLPTEILQKSIAKIPDYVKINFKSQNLTQENQLKLVHDLKKSKTWVDLHSLWDKNKRGGKYFRPFAERIRLNQKDQRFQSIVSDYLERENFDGNIIRIICPSYKSPINSTNHGLGSRLVYKQEKNVENVCLMTTDLPDDLKLADDRNLSIQMVTDVSENEPTPSNNEENYLFEPDMDLDFCWDSYTMDANRPIAVGFENDRKIGVAENPGWLEHGSFVEKNDQMENQFPSTPEIEQFPLICLADEDGPQTIFSGSDCTPRRSTRFRRTKFLAAENVGTSGSTEYLDEPSTSEYSPSGDDYSSGDEDFTHQVPVEKNDTVQNFTTEIEEEIAESEDDDGSLLTPTEICAVLEIDKSMLSYQPPSKLEMKIPPNVIDGMFEFESLTTNNGRKFWNVTFRKRMWASTFSKFLSESEFPCSFSTRHAPRVSPKYKEGKLDNNNFAYADGHCGGGCELKFRLIFTEKPNPGVYSKCIVEAQGAFELYRKEGSTARRLSDEQRKNVKSLLKNSKSNKVFLENISHLSALQLLHKNKFVMSDNVLRTAAWEENVSKRSDKMEILDLQAVLTDQLRDVSPKSNLPGYLRQLAMDPFHYEMYMWKQVKLTNVLAQKSDLWLTLDASGRIVRLPKEQKGQDKQVLNYVVDVMVDGIKPFPLAEMVTTNNKATNVKAFLSRVLDDVKKAGPRKPNLVAGVVTDMSLALIHACCEAVNIDKFIDYVKRSYAILRRECQPRPDKAVFVVCVNHLMNAFRQNVKSRCTNEDIRKLSMAALARIQECFDLDDFYYVCEKVLYIFGNQFVEKTKVEKFADDIRMKNSAKNEWEIETHVLDFELEVMYIEEMEKKRFSTLKTGNQFYENFYSLRRKICPDLPVKLPRKSIQITNYQDDGEKAECLGSRQKNPFFFPSILELLENTYIPMVPFFSAMVPRHCGFPDFVRKSNAVVESTFKTNKQQWHRQRNMHNGNFVREHFELVHGKINDVLTSVGQRKSASVSKVSLLAATNPKEKFKKPHQKSQDSHSVKEEWGPPKSTKKRIRPRHLSDVKILNTIRGVDCGSGNQTRKLKPSRGHDENIKKLLVESSPITDLSADRIPHQVSKKDAALIKLGCSAIGCVTPLDLESLFLGSRWLISSFMDFYSSLLVQKYNEQGINMKHLKNVEILPSYAVGPNLKNEIEVNLAAFFRLADDTDTIFVPMNVQQCHWILLQIEYIKSGTRYVTIYDSKTGAVDDDVLDEQLELVKKNMDDRFGKSDWVIYMEKTVQQTDGHSCGPSVLYILDKTLSQSVSTYTTEDLVAYRLEMLKNTLQTTETGREILEKFTEHGSLVDFVLTDVDEMARIQNKYSKVHITKVKKNVYFDD